MSIEQRLNELKRLKTEEENSSERSQNYISDLDLSIKDCERQLKAKTDKGYKMVKV